MIDDEVNAIHAALANPERKDVKNLISYLRAFTYIKKRLTHEKAVGDEAAVKLREEMYSNEQ